SRRQPGHGGDGVGRTMTDGLQERLVLLLAGAPREVFVTQAGGMGGEGHHRTRALWVCGREQQRHAPAQVGAEESGALGADRVEHEANVVHVLLDGLAARRASITISRENDASPCRNWARSRFSHSRPRWLA